MISGVAVLVGLFIVYGLVSKYLAKTPLTGPIVFVAAGLIAGPEALDLVTVELDSEIVQTVLEMALVVILFTDAAIIDVRSVRRHLSLPTRLLTIGLIGTIASGILVAQWMFGELGFWGAAVIAVTLAPTDAALGQAVVTNEMVPKSVRQGLSVESGLNDGIAVPFLSIAIAGLGGEMVSGSGVAKLFAEEIGIALVVGIVVGLIGGWLILQAYRRGWMSREWRQVSVPLLAVLCFLIAQPLHGSGFIAAFVGGMAFGHVVRRHYPDVCTLSESTAYLLTMLSFFIFGALILGPRISSITFEIVVYALASLTVIRFVPVAISMIRSDAAWPTVAFIGWFGPRGIASLVFVGTVVAETDAATTEVTLTVVAATVGLSVLLHGVSAWPLSNAYGRWLETMQEDEDMADMVEMVEVPDVMLPLRVTEASDGFTFGS